MLLIYTTDLQKIKTALPVRKAVSFYMTKVRHLQSQNLSFMYDLQF